MILLAVILLLVLIGARLFVIVGVATALSFYLYTDQYKTMEALLLIVEKVEGLTTKNLFLSLPFFIAAGVVMTQGGIARRLIAVARAMVGWLPGGLAIATVFACVIFAAISGSSPVTLIAVGVVMFPALSASGYPENFSLGILTTAGSLGCLVPPAISMLIYSISVGGNAAIKPDDLFLAGLVPALLIAGLLCVYAAWVGRGIPQSREPFEWKKLKAALYEGSFALVLPVIILGGIYTGMFTPTEAGAVALVYSIFCTTFIYRDMTLSKLPDLFAESATLIGSLILIVTLSFGLNDLLQEVRAGEYLIRKLIAADLSPFAFFMFVNVVLIVLGALMDSISATLIFAPLLAPIAMDVYGIDPLHFGVVFVVNMEIGYLMPPVATNLFVASAVFQRPFGQVTRAVMPTLGIVCGALILCMYVPTISKAAVNWKKDAPIYEAFPWTKPDVEFDEDTGTVRKKKPAKAPRAAPGATPAGTTTGGSEATTGSGTTGGASGTTGGSEGTTSGDSLDDLTNEAEKAGAPESGGDSLDDLTNEAEEAGEKAGPDEPAPEPTPEPTPEPPTQP